MKIASDFPEPESSANINTYYTYNTASMNTFITAKTYFATVYGYDQTFCETIRRPLPVERYTYSYKG